MKNTIDLSIYKLLVEEVADYGIFILSPEGIIKTWNKGAQIIKGYSEDEIVGKHFSTFYPEDDIESGKPEYELVVADKTGRFEDEGWRIRKDGSRFWANVIITALRENGNLIGYSKVTRDLTQRKNEAEALKEARDKYKMLVDQVRDYAIFMLDINGFVASWNKGAEKIKGYKPKEILGKHFSIFYTEEGIQEGKPELEIKTAIETGRFEDEGWRLRKDGTRFWANVILTALYREEKLIGFSKITRDLSERRKSEQESELMRSELQRSNVELEKYASVVSHDLKEPLRSVNMFADLFMRENGKTLNDESKRYLTRITGAAKRMEKIIVNLLSFSKLSAGKEVQEEINIGEVLHEVIEDLELSIKEKDAQVIINGSCIINGFPFQIRQLLQNLISNALKFSKKDIPPIVEISLECSDLNKENTIVVKDNGIGFEEQYANLIFELFQRLNSRDVYEGTGIGLSICKKIVENHGGRIEAKSVLNEGTSFIITLPR